MLYTFIIRANYEIEKLNLLISSSTNLIKTVVEAEPYLFFGWPRYARIFYRIGFLVKAEQPEQPGRCRSTLPSPTAAAGNSSFSTSNRSPTNSSWPWTKKCIFETVVAAALFVPYLCQDFKDPLLNLLLLLSTAFLQILFFIIILVIFRYTTHTL